MRRNRLGRPYGGLTHISDLIAGRLAIADSRTEAASNQTVTVLKAASTGKTEQMLDVVLVSHVDTRMQHQAPRLAPIVTR